MTTPKNTSTMRRTATMWPTVRYRDAHAAIAFLVNVLGFEQDALYGEGERVDHAELSRPNGDAIMLGSLREDGPSFPAAAGSIYLAVEHDELIRLHDAAVAAGAEISDPLTDKDYGGSGFTCRDPEGAFWSFGTYRGHRG